MEIKSKNGRHFAVFEIDRQTAIDYTNKLNTHKFEIDVVDNRSKSYDQVKLFWSMLNEFVEFLFGEHISKDEKDKLKLALYSEYQTEKNVKISLSKSSVTSCRLFVNWVIKKFADEYNFIPTNIQLQDEFADSYAYACLVSNKCAICGYNGVPIKFGKGYVSLCEQHKELKKKELYEQYHLPAIPMSESTIEFLKGEQ